MTAFLVHLKYLEYKDETLRECYTIGPETYHERVLSKFPLDFPLPLISARIILEKISFLKLILMERNKLIEMFPEVPEDILSQLYKCFRNKIL